MRFAMALLFCTLLAAAEDPWMKVRQLKSGTELRIFRKGSAQPLMAKLDEATEDHLAIVWKNTQQAIPKEDIDRLDYRPPSTGSRVTKETRQTTESPEKSAPSRVPGASIVPSQSSSSSVSIGGKPDFETLYRRPPGPPPQTPPQ